MLLLCHDRTNTLRGLFSSIAFDVAPGFLKFDTETCHLTFVKLNFWSVSLPFIQWTEQSRLRRFVREREMVRHHFSLEE